MTEAQEIKRDGGSAQPNSGRRKIGRFKGDARVGPFVYDIKEYARSFAVNAQVWAKASTDAIRAGGIPAIKIVIGSGRETIRLWVISDVMFHEMLDAWEEKYGESA